MSDQSELAIISDPILMLKTFDSKGQLRIDAVHYRRFEGGFVLMASHSDTGSKPEWYLNLKADPLVELDVDGTERFAVASTPIGRERMDIWPLVESMAEDIKRERPRNITGVLLTPMD